MMGLLRNLKPQWWFSAHLHTRFEATVVHDAPSGAPPAAAPAPAKVEGTNPDEIAIDDIDADESERPQETPAEDVAVHPTSNNPDEIKLDEEEEETVAPPPPPPPPRETKFLALDKCLPKRRFLEVSLVPLCLRSTIDDLFVSR